VSVAGDLEADGVFQGGGMKGLALIGALIGFAAHPRLSVKRWRSVAGTSAGAIVASLLATGHDIEDLERLMRAAPYPKFEDTGPPVIGGLENLVRRHGLAHGDYFHAWIDEQLGGATFASVKATPAEGGAGAGYRLRLIATDVTRHEMLVLPEDLQNYLRPGGHEPIQPDGFKIADAVRMSMSIPYFFQPVELLHRESGAPSTIVDGGVLSNFPVWLFDVADRQPIRPTFGFRLVGGRGVGGGLQKLIDHLGWPVELGTDIVHTATDAWDTRFMTHSTIVRTCPVDAGDVGTTDFHLSESQEQGLIDGGRSDGERFLDQFQTSSYVNTYGHPLAPEAPMLAGFAGPAGGPEG
jgi:NTE family protein